VNPLVNEFRDAQLLSYNNGRLINLKNQNDEPCAYCIRFGFVKAYTISNAGDEHILVILRRGDVFPLIPLIYKNGGGNHKIFFEALGRVKLLQLPREQLVQRIDKNLSLTNAVLNQLCDQFLTSGQHTENLLGKSANQKLVYCLQYLATRYGHSQGDSSFLDSVFTHKLIGNTIGLTRGTVTKEFDRLRSKNLINTTRGRTYIVSMKSLAKEYGEPFTLTA
jgi:CRP-like cAMP-binding protein